MTQPFIITGIAGSLRRDSYARAVLRGIAPLLPTGSRFETLDIGALPHYNQDLDTEAAPEAVVAGRAQIDRSDAVIIVTPEFNHGLPGVLKNALDWLSRPAFTSCFVGKPALFVTIGPGALGGVRAQAQLRETLTAMLCRLVPLHELVVPLVNEKITDGELTDTVTLRHLSRALDIFLGASARG
ncbi:MAG TPA: NADPH-dependent FMN reductase [Acidisoma sp.]|jgi:chromate reductase|uniref:NADPH-dependent FMN reductase n=1 Tax=Acidisoma sp. TaxID=1872115 RepID=UPI002B982F39|nr:NADPH-dependent FMN reductase [Acidisoma sp.]HTI03435.1 NADPH-dependent FMN reductase [Acidisoma sp.]